MHCFVPCTTMCVVWSDMQVNKERLNICFYSDSRTPYSTILILTLEGFTSTIQIQVKYSASHKLQTKLTVLFTS